MLLNIPGSVIISSDVIDKSVNGFSIGAPRFNSTKIKDTDGLYRVGIAKRTNHYQSETATAFCRMIEKFYKEL